MVSLLKLTRTSLLLAACLAAPASYAKKSAFVPAGPGQAKRLKGFEKCRKDALRQLKAGSGGKPAFEAALAVCKDNFPGAALYATCKKDAVKAAKPRDAEAEEAALAPCRKLLASAELDTAAPVPFFVTGDQLFFAGIGLNKAQGASLLHPPNFDCRQVAKALTAGPTAAQYLLFGNNPRVFQPLKPLKGAALAKAIGATEEGAGSKPQKSKKGKKGKKGETADAGAAREQDLPGFGRLYGSPTASKSNVFFPVAACNFAAEPGELFAGFSAYYLLGQTGHVVTPYFGIAYYRADQETISTPKLVRAVTQKLGAGFRTTSKNKQVTFVSQADLSDLDDEGDPRNVCETPRPHHLIAIVQGRRDDPQRPEYLMIANVKNLCEFGDTLARHLFE